jgi:hypothetical protein
MLLQFDYVTKFPMPLIMIYFLYNSSCRKYMRSRCRVHLCLQASFFVGRTWVRRRDPKHGRIRRWRGWWHRQWRGAMIVCHVSLCQDYVDFCVKTMYCCAKTMNFRWFISCCVIVVYYFCYMPCFGSSPSREASKTGVI